MRVLWDVSESRVGRHGWAVGPPDYSVVSEEQYPGKPARKTAAGQRRTLCEKTFFVEDGDGVREEESDIEHLAKVGKDHDGRAGGRVRRAKEQGRVTGELSELGEGFGEPGVQQVGVVMTTDGTDGRHDE